MRAIERSYIANADNGHEYFDFEFTSEHRANSKANFEDAKREYRKKHGHCNFRIISTFKID